MVTNAKKNVNIIVFLNLVISIGSASYWTISSLILKDLTGSKSDVGIYFSCIYAFIIIATFFIAYLFNKLPKSLILPTALLSCGLSLLSMAFTKSIAFFIITNFAWIFSLILVRNSLILFISDNSNEKNLSANQGKNYLFLNLGYVVGPIISGFIAENFGNNYALFLPSALMIIAMLLFIIMPITDEEFKTQTHSNKAIDSFRYFIKFFRNKERTKVFINAIGLYFWISAWSIYIPLGVTDLGYGQYVVGIIITLSILPLIVLEPMIGKWATIVGYKRYIIRGFIIVSCFAFLIGFSKGHPLFTLGLYVLMNIGVAFIEPLHEVYYFDNVEREDKEEMLGTYNLSSQIANIVSPLICSLLLFVGGDIYFMWGFVGLIMLLFIYNSLSIKEKLKL
jgi:DHA1 family quinolone resistance protein-like MFS transporter